MLLCAGEECCFEKGFVWRILGAVEAMEVQKLGCPRKNSIILVRGLPLASYTAV